MDYTRAPMPRYLIQLHDGSERTIQADRLELEPPIQTCRFYFGDAAEDVALDTIRSVVLVDAHTDELPLHNGIEVKAFAPDAVEITQPSLTQPGTINVVYVPVGEIEWVVTEMRRERLVLPAGRRRVRPPSKRTKPRGDAKRRSAKARRRADAKKKPKAHKEPA